MQERALAQVIEPILGDFGLELDALDVTPVGRRAVVRVTVDGDGPEGKGPLLDDIASASRAVSAALDESDTVGDAPFTLEMSSRGVSKPLTHPKHYRRNTGRLVKLWLGDAELEGRIVGAEDDAVALDVKGEVTKYLLDDITKAVIQVEMNRKED
ncbi:MAG: ribosome maturation factor RimP [Propionibacterium sp.]|nr:ribosome maturation factor RimP [Propionibacterium sp.]